MGFFNQYSFPVFAIFAGILLFVGLGYVPNLAPILRFVVTGAYVLLAFWLGMSFRYPDSPVEVETVADVESTLSNSKPTFVMLYSNY